MSSGITEHCNRLESRQLGSAQVSLAGDFCAVLLPTAAHGNMILQQTQNNPRRSHLAGFAGGEKEIIGSSFPEASYWHNICPLVHNGTKVSSALERAWQTLQRVRTVSSAPMLFSL